MSTAGNFFAIVYGLMALTLHSSAARFTSHVSVRTPARSYSHGVGDLAPSPTLSYHLQRKTAYRTLKGPGPSLQNGYQRVNPTVPFYGEEIIPENTLSASPWQYDFYDTTIPLLPPSPYRVNSPNPESLWPEGLFLPPVEPHTFQTHRAAHRSDDEVLSDNDSFDPYLLEGTEAIAAVRRADDHGHLFFQDIPHIESLLANQELRIKNKLKPHRIASIRHTWPFNRP